MQNFASFFIEYIKKIVYKIKNKKFIDLIFPQSCIICGKINEKHLCDKCKKRIQKFEKNKYISNINYIEKFLTCGKINFEKLFYCYEYKGVIRKIIINYKFNDRSYICNYFANMLLNCKKTYRFLKFYDIIIPVPMERTRKLKRGYNQTELITDIITKKVDILNGKDLIVKIKHTNMQSTLNLEKRKENIKNAFSVYNKNIIKGKRIILFDDICTTGNTINEISRILKEFGAKEILVLVIAKD